MLSLVRRLGTPGTAAAVRALESRDRTSPVLLIPVPAFLYPQPP
jgi:hypothetical protein